MNIPTILIYLLVKIFAYVWWCRVGLEKRLQESTISGPSVVKRSLGLGIIRSILGLVFGVVIYFLTISLLESFGSNMFGAQFLVYLLVYIPIRWIEWSIMALFLYGESRSLWGFIWGGSAVDRKWRGTGILISCLADVPIIMGLHGHLFLGRIMC